MKSSKCCFILNFLLYLKQGNSNSRDPIQRDPYSRYEREFGSVDGKRCTFVSKQINCRMLLNMGISSLKLR